MRWLLMTLSSCITVLRSSCSLTTALFTSPRRTLMELFASGSLGKPLVGWKLEQGTEGEWSTFWAENSAQLLLEIWLVVFLAESELSGSISSRLRLSISSSSENSGTLGTKCCWALAVLSLCWREAEGDCWWDKVQKEDPGKVGDKWWPDFSGGLNSGDDTDKVEKEDVPSEVVGTKMYKWERYVIYKWE